MNLFFTICKGIGYAVGWVVGSVIRLIINFFKWLFGLLK